MSSLPNWPRRSRPSSRRNRWRTGSARPAPRPGARHAAAGEKFVEGEWTACWRPCAAFSGYRKASGASKHVHFLFLVDRCRLDTRFLDLVIHSSRPLDQAFSSPLYAGMSEFVMPFPVLVCDVGGTNARFALKRDAATRRLGAAVHLKTGDYPGLVEAVEAAIAQARRAAAFADRLRRRAGRWTASSSSPTRPGSSTGREVGAPAQPRPRAAVQRFRGAGAVAAGDPARLGAADRPGRVRAARAAGHSRPRHRPRRRRADRGVGPPHAARLGSLPHRFRPGRRRGERRSGRISSARTAA